MGTDRREERGSTKQDHLFMKCALLAGLQAALHCAEEAYLPATRTTRSLTSETWTKRWRIEKVAPMFRCAHELKFFSGVVRSKRPCPCLHQGFMKMLPIISGTSSLQSFATKSEGRTQGRGQTFSRGQ